MAPPPRTGASDEEARISEELTTLHDAAFGGGGCDLSTFLIDDVVLCLIGLPLMVGEQTLLDSGVGAVVCDTRSEFECSMSASMAAVIEHSTGRSVVGFFTDVRLDPPLTVDLFHLAPVPA
jgi:uncharacterized protein YbcI